MLRIVILGIVLFFNKIVINEAEGIRCPIPETDVNTRVEVPSLESGSIATYTCDPGYEVFGATVRVCGADGKWTGELPTCATNVAWRKPVNQSSTARGGDGINANDGDKTTVHDGNKCTQTTVENSPWWAVDLLQEFEVSVVRITTRGCCGQEPAKDLEVRVGESPDLQKNRLCAWIPGALGEGITEELKCARPINGRYVFIQMAGVRGSLSLCEVEVFSREQFSKDRCKGEVNVDTLGIFNQTCYDFHITKGGSFETAKSSCQNLRLGNLVNNIEPISQKYLVSELERHKDKMKTSMVWIGVEREKDLISRTWRWIDGALVEKPSWGRDQPNNYNGEQNCVVLDGNRDWLWNDVGCNLNYLFWICQFSPSCGTPDKKQNTTVLVNYNENNIIATYSCPVGNKINGEESRTCNPSGHWTGGSPTCEYVDCGQPPLIENGEFSLSDGRTTFAASAIYKCSENYTMDGEDTILCGRENRWEPEAPKCWYSWCPDLEIPKHSQLLSSGQRAGDAVTFVCDHGYFLIGKKTISCLLGGKWSHEIPTCKYIDCGLPEVIENGQMKLINATTYLGSEVKYECKNDYIIDGLSHRFCEENGYWTGEKPSCKLINCGEPDIPIGGYAIGDKFDIHSHVQYHCEEGHYMSGDAKRICLNSGLWSGETPTCTFVDCSTPSVVIKGTIEFLAKEKTTHLNSEIKYTCSPDYELIGPEIRKCQRNGQWSGQNPRCREIRCATLSHPEHGEASLSKGDLRVPLHFTRTRNNRRRNATHQVGTEFTYRCVRGYAVQGDRFRTCLSTGQWSGEAPTCKFVDCGAPKNISNGSYRLLNDVTSVGAFVLYSCIENYTPTSNYRRQCQDDGTWSGEQTECREILCSSLSDELQRRYNAEDKRVVDSVNPSQLKIIEESNLLRLQVEDGERRVDTSATYKCRLGQKIIGKETRECSQNGVWNGREPRCRWIICDEPESIPNGRIHFHSEPLKYGSVIEYFCLPKYRLEGVFNRTCTEEGTWSGDEPVCTLDDLDKSVFGDNTVDGTSNLARGPTEGELEDASYTGIYVGISVSLILVIGVGLAFLFMRTRQKRSKTSPSPPPDRTKPNNFERPEIVNYGYLNDPTAGDNIYEHIPENMEVSSYANMSPASSSSSSPHGSYSNYRNHTYSNSSNGTTPTYSNTDEDVKQTNHQNSNGKIPYHISQRPRMPPPQPPPNENVAPGVTINGVALQASVT